MTRAVAQERDRHKTVDETAIIPPTLRQRRRAFSRQDEVRLAQRIQRGDMEAKNQLVEEHLRLVMALAQR